ncbi:NUDIX domain-containing protein [Gracilinema caldarium]|uniref:NUDIX hydrolase n=1 Tax=Gracilinema caldarium (strain ATCC 51460 / DSM 7334 / H1) TaxID=744872 RepID=F8EYA6_GRAC1|nr:NUDIX domain-containing protein [Gracilinema caldarium]AEJ18265.1 NUDIX hydrolase [Gracilinema caldarium DSM 7334]
MSDKQNEQVLCVARSALAELIDLSQELFHIDEHTAFQAMQRGGAAFIIRRQAEQDPSYKQLIPYCILQDPEGRFLCYPRQGTEKRLHGLYSLGIGGHINPEDAVLQDDQIDVERTVMRALVREASEEAGLQGHGMKSQFRGLIHEERSPVGMVHLGLVYTIQTRSELLKPGEELAGSLWLSPEALKEKLETESASLETWSTLALELIGQGM